MEYELERLSQGQNNRRIIKDADHIRNVTGNANNTGNTGNMSDEEKQVYEYVKKAYYFFIYGCKKIISWIKLPERMENIEWPKMPSVKTMTVWAMDILATIPPQLVFALFCFSYIIYYAYIKIKYPYWNLCPVRHTFDWKPVFVSSPYLIHTGQFMPNTKYNDNKWQMITLPFLDKTAVDYYDKAVDLLRCHYIPADNALYTITTQQFISYHTGDYEPAFITVYSVMEYDTAKMAGEDNSGNMAMVGARPPPMNAYATENIQGIMTSHFCHFMVWHGDEYLHWNSYYSPFFCLHRDNKKARHLFQTHMSNVYKRNSSSVKMGIFKKEVDLCEGVVPLVEFNTYMYAVDSDMMHTPQLPAHHIILEITKSNHLDILANTVNFMNCRKGYSCIITCNMPYYLALLGSSSAHIYCHSAQDVIYGIFIFKQTYIEYETAGEKSETRKSVQVITLQNVKNDELFYLGFMNALAEYVKLYKPSIIMLENIGSNYIINARLQKYREYLTQTRGAYYTYNLVVPASPLPIEKCVVFM